MLNIEIQYDTVLNAILNQLKKIYPDYKVYKNIISSPKYPNFFVNQIYAIPVPDTKNFWWLDYLFAIEYRQSEDLKVAMNLEETLDEVAFNLNKNLWYLDEIKTWIKNPNTDKGEGVLSFTFNVRIRVRTEELQALMQELTINYKENQMEV